MEITWLGHSCFRLRSREATIVTDPYRKELGYALGKPTADIVTVSHDHPGHNNLAGVGGQPRLVDGPGEYEIKGVMITGIRTYHDADGGKQRGKNTAYLIEMEGLVVCHLGDLGHLLTPAQAEAMSNVDILLIPVGGNSTISSMQAAEVISLVEPKLVVPMHYHTSAITAELDPVDRFCREMGVPNLEPQPKLVANATTLPEETQVVVLEYRKA